MPEYTVQGVANTAPKEYANAFGITYYHRVKLVGVDKAVSIGKKAPNAIKAGDIINGSIETTAFSEDKWHGEAPAPGAGGFTGPTPQASTASTAGTGYTPRDDSHIKAQWAIGQATTFYLATAKIELGTKNRMEVVEALAAEYFAMVERVKNVPVVEPLPEPPADGFGQDEAPDDINQSIPDEWK